MAKYKILVIAHQLKNKVIAKYGDTVDEVQLMGNALELVSTGFIELVEEVENDDFDLSKLTAKELIQFAKDNDYIVDEKAKKSELLDSIINKIEVETEK